MLLVAVVLLAIATTANAFFNEPNMTMELLDLRPCGGKGTYQSNFNLTGVYFKEWNRYGFLGQFNIPEDLMGSLKWTYQLSEMKEDHSYKYFLEDESEQQEMGAICNTLAWQEMVNSGSCNFLCPFEQGKQEVIATPVNITSFFPEEKSLNYGKPHQDFFRLYDSRDNTVVVCFIFEAIAVPIRTAEEVEEDTKREEEKERRREERRKQREEKRKKKKEEQDENQEEEEEEEKKEEDNDEDEK